jgi:hypothetical protein
LGFSNLGEKSNYKNTVIRLLGANTLNKLEKTYLINKKFKIDGLKTRSLLASIMSTNFKRFALSSLTSTSLVIVWSLLFDKNKPKITARSFFNDFAICFVLHNVGWLLKSLCLFCYKRQYYAHLKDVYSPNKDKEIFLDTRLSLNKLVLPGAYNQIFDGDRILVFQIKNMTPELVVEFLHKIICDSHVSIMLIGDNKIDNIIQDNILFFNKNFDAIVIIVCKIVSQKSHQRSHAGKAFLDSLVKVCNKQISEDLLIDNRAMKIEFKHYKSAYF